MLSPAKQVDPRDLFITRNPTGLTGEELEKGRSGFVDHRTHGDYLVFLSGYEAAAGLDPSDEGQGQHALIEAEGYKPEISIRPVTSAAAGTAAHDLNQAEGGQPDLNFHLLQLAERSCSLLEDWLQATDKRDGPLAEQIRETRALLESQQPTWSIAAYEILAERRRQIHAEGYTASRDDQYTSGQLAEAASAYAFWAHPLNAYPGDHLLLSDPPALWPWSAKSWKPTSERLMLVKAGALLLAELARLDRLSIKEAAHEE